MYLEYWGLKRSPFDNVPDPAMFFDRHPGMASAVSDLLFAISEGNECLAVLVGDVGLGKTMTLRMVLNALEPDRYRIAYLTNPDLTFPQILREILGQLQGQTCTLRGKDLLLEEFNRLLFETADEGGKVVVFIDEANALRSPVLEGLRLLTNLQEDDRNLLTLILAGQPKLTRMLRDARRANLYQRVGVFIRLEPLESAKAVRAYIHHRLQRAGGSLHIFTPDAVAAVYVHTGGVPRLINRLCKLALKAGEVRGLRQVEAWLVHEVAERFELREASRERRADPRTLGSRESSSDASAVTEEPEASLLREEDERSLTARESNSEQEAPSPPEGPQAAGASAPQNPDGPPPGEADPTLSPAPTFSSDPGAVSREGASPAPEIIPSGNGSGRVGENDGGSRRRPEAAPALDIPEELIEALRRLPDERQRMRLAGQLAARQIQQHPERYADASIDPVRTWDELRARILALAS